MTTTVLIIDDAVHIRRLVVRMLKRAGYATLEANDGVEGLAVLRRDKPDIVTCDLSMPRMNGLEFLDIVKADAATKSIPIVVVTAIGQEDEAVMATQVGADAYLTKPFSSNHLIETIQQLLT